MATWDSSAVLTCAAAAKLTFWPQLPVARIEVALTSRHGSHGNVTVVRRRIPPDLIVERHGLRCTSPALTALDLSTTIGGNAVDTVLRTRRPRCPSSTRRWR